MDVLSMDQVEPAIREAVNEAVKNRLIKLISTIYQNGYITRPMAEKIFNTTRATMQRSFAILKLYDLVTFSGAQKTGKYLLTEQAKHLIKEMLKK